MRALTHEELNQVAGGCFSWSKTSFWGCKTSYSRDRDCDRDNDRDDDPDCKRDTKNDCNPKPSCEPKPVCNPKPVYPPVEEPL